MDRLPDRLDRRIDNGLEGFLAELFYAEVGNHGVGARKFAKSLLVRIGSGLDQLGRGNTAANVLVRGRGPGGSPLRRIEQASECPVEESLHIGRRDRIGGRVPLGEPERCGEGIVYGELRRSRWRLLVVRYRLYV